MFSDTVINKPENNITVLVKEKEKDNLFLAFHMFARWANQSMGEPTINDSIMFEPAIVEINDRYPQVQIITHPRMKAKTFS